MNKLKRTLALVLAKVRHRHEQLTAQSGSFGAWAWWILLSLLILIPLFLRLGPGPWDGESFSQITKKLKLATEGQARLVLWWQAWWQPEVLREEGLWDKLKGEHYGVLGRWWAGVFSWCVVWAMFLSWRFWAVSFDTKKAEKQAALIKNQQESGKKKTWVLWGLLLALIVALPARLPKMNHSFWQDEIYAAEEYILGEWKLEKKSGELEFRERKWADTVAGNRLVNNHMFYSMSARACLEAWRLLNRHGAHEWAEWPLRVPSLLAGLASIFLIGWMFIRRGWVIAGLVSAFTLALHPWHAYWSADARGYALMLFFLLLTIECLLRAWQSRSLWAWGSFGLAQAALLSTYAPMLYVLFALNLSVLACLVWGLRKPMGKLQFNRWIWGNLLGAMVTSLFLMPLIPQTKGYFHENSWSSMGKMDKNWWADVSSHLYLGQRRESAESIPVQLPNLATGEGIITEVIQVPHPSSTNKSLMELAWWNPALHQALLVILGLVCICGFIFLLLRNLRIALFLLAPLIGSVLCWAVTALSGGYLFGWYLFAMILSLVWLAGFGVEAAWKIKHPLTRKTLGSFFLLALINWGILGHFQRKMQAHETRMPLREAIATVHGKAPIFSPQERANVTLLTMGTGKGRVQSFDPQVIALDRKKENLEGDGNSRTDLNAIAARYAKPEKELYLIFCAPNLYAQEFPLAWQQLKSAPWELVKEIPGTEAMYSYRVYRHRVSDSEDSSDSKN